MIRSVLPIGCAGVIWPTVPMRRYRPVKPPWKPISLVYDAGLASYRVSRPVRADTSQVPQYPQE